MDPAAANTEKETEVHGGPLGLALVAFTTQLVPGEGKECFEATLAALLVLFGTKARHCCEWVGGGGGGGGGKSKSKEVSG